MESGEKTEKIYFQCFPKCFRRSEERIAEHLNRDSQILFDLTNPIFFDKNILFENYSNLRKHLQNGPRSSAENGSCDVKA